jgi:hypothetical protein
VSSGIDGDEARGLLADAEAEESVEATATLPAAAAAAGRTGYDVVPEENVWASTGASSGGAEGLRSSESRGFDVAGSGSGR